eukprot:gnl/Spiro4/13034_TR6912_c0_g1_i1.p2 gnl/Spiro4/13034_TR6912_c0_g1~~gnl/Spiro4/13034_TR6912_c0_g1_i1.p2  ORF type:complete len:133 (+),score=30.89 gnl/Spiro4/13034_TR6912_c0_g1_i1:31-399(+)
MAHRSPRRVLYLQIGTSNVVPVLVSVLQHETRWFGDLQTQELLAFLRQLLPQSFSVTKSGRLVCHSPTLGSQTEFLQGSHLRMSCSIVPTPALCVARRLGGLSFAELVASRHSVVVWAAPPH